MRLKDLKITLSQNISGFSKPKIKLEQYQTPAEVAATLVFRAYQLGDIEDKHILDVCAGTGILGIAANLMGGNCNFLDIDEDALTVLHDNIEKFMIDATVFHEDIFGFHGKYDTILINPPFGIQGRISDVKFIAAVSKLANVIYSIHDGSQANEQNLPKLLVKHGLKVTEMYYHDFILENTYSFHKQKNKRHKVLILRSVTF